MGALFSWEDPSKIVCPQIENLFCFKLDAMSVPEALATTIRILLMFSIVLAHLRALRVSGNSLASPAAPPASPGIILWGGDPHFDRHYFMGGDTKDECRQNIWSGRHYFKTYSGGYPPMGTEWPSGGNTKHFDAQFPSDFSVTPWGHSSAWRCMFLKDFQHFTGF